jgi:GT2 family glycosyltransferase
LYDIDALSAAGRWFGVATLYADAVLRDILSPTNWVQLGHALKESGALSEAEAAYRSAIACDGADPDPWLHLAHLLKLQNRLEDALTTFETLRTFAHPPDVSQEIRGLCVALLPANRMLRQSVGTETTSALPRELRTVLQQTQSLFRKALTEDEEPSLKRVSPSIRLRGRRNLGAKLVPRAHLVIRDGIFVATTSNPQFDILFDGPLSGGWVEIEVGIEAEVPFVEPVLLIEHWQRWQKFSYAKLRPRTGRFHAICFIKEPALNLRLNPIEFAGPFTVTHFTLQPISIFKVIKIAWDLADDTARRGLLSWYRHGSFTNAMQDLAAFLAYPGLDSYQRWTATHGVTTPAESASQYQQVERWLDRPHLSICLLYGPSDGVEIEETLSSLKLQSYLEWSLCIVHNRPLNNEDRRYLDHICEGLPKISLHDSMASAVSAIGQDYVITLHAGSRLSPKALLRFAEEIIEGCDASLIYCDEDHLRDGKRCEPLFKPDWDPDFQAATGYIGDFLAIRCDLLKHAYVHPTSSYETWSEVVSRVIANLSNPRVIHIAEVLHHRRFSQAERDAFATSTSTQPVVDTWPSVSLIIPTRDSVDLLRQCINSLRSQTDYPNVEIVVVDNGSTESTTLAYFNEIESAQNISIVRVPGPFNFSRLNNIAIEHARGSIIGLVNNDILAIEPHWLKVMVTEAVRPQIGAVGAKLLYPSGHVQHAGIACGVGLVAAHPHKFRARDDVGYMHRLSSKHRVSAVTAACLVVEKRKYLEVGGMDEEDLQIAFNDVDFCLKLGKAGYHNLFTPQARLIHLESATRGLDLSPEKAARYLKEAETMLSRWKTIILHDPYYNVNLSRKREDYSVGE